MNNFISKYDNSFELQIQFIILFHKHPQIQEYNIHHPRVHKKNFDNLIEESLMWQSLWKWKEIQQKKENQNIT